MNKFRFITLPLLISSLLLLGACEDYIQNVSPLIDVVEDDLLDEAANLPFLSNGLRVRFATTHDRLGVQSDGLSDMFEFDQSVDGATFPTYAQLDVGIIELDNNSIDGVFADLGELRFFADNLVDRAVAVVAAEGASDETEEAQFAGKLYGGIARYFYAVYFGLTEEVGGGVIDGGPFITSNVLYDDAITFLTSALTFTEDANMIRSIHTMMARAALYKGDFASAATQAGLGLVSGDAGHFSEYSSESTNQYWQQAGVGRNQWILAWRFSAYVVADTLEMVRVPHDSVWSQSSVDSARIRQLKYAERDDPIMFASWQENNLMLAELAVRGQTVTGTAVDLVNAVRAASGLADLSTVDLEVIYVERDKELFCTGSRLADQRRFEGELSSPTWHLGAGTWKFLPITENERVRNENLEG